MSAPRTNVIAFPYANRPGTVYARSRHPEVAEASDRWIALSRARDRLARQERRALKRLHAAVDRSVSFEAFIANREMVACDRANRLQHSADAGLLVAEEELVRLLDESRDDPECDGPKHDARWDRIGELMAFIAAMPPKTLEGCAVKLRRLADEETGLECGDREDDVPCLRQVLAFVEDAYKSGGAA
jgi:hypothetical protein